MHYDALRFKNNEVCLIHKDNSISVIDYKPLIIDKEISICLKDNKLSILNTNIVFNCTGFNGLIGLEAKESTIFKKLSIR